VSSYRGSGEFYQGEPIFLPLSIRRLKTEASDIPPETMLPIGTQEIPWYRHVSLQLYRIEEIRAAEQAEDTQVAADIIFYPQPTYDTPNIHGEPWAAPAVDPDAMCSNAGVESAANPPGAGDTTVPDTFDDTSIRQIRLHVKH